MWWKYFLTVAGHENKFVTPEGDEKFITPEGDEMYFEKVFLL